MMEKKDLKKKRNKDDAPLKKECSSNHAQYKWIKHMFARQDELREDITRLETRVSEISVKVACGIGELRQRVETLEDFLGGQESIKEVLKDRNIYKQCPSTNNESDKRCPVKRKKT